MLDPTLMYPNLYHPIKIHKNKDLKGKAPHFTRTLHPPRYHFIDFGLAEHFPEGSHPLAEQIWGGDKTVPEFQNSAAPCDPFATDVYYIGNVVRRHLLDVSNFSICPTRRFNRFGQRYRGLDVIKSLIDTMVQDEPSERPLMADALAQLNRIVRSLSQSELRSRLPRREDSMVVMLWRLCAHTVRNARYVLKGIPPIPGKTSSND
jgi:hypothetical protein